MAKQKGMVLLDRLLSDIDLEYNEIMFECMSKAMKQAKADVKAASPSGPGGYKNGWSVRTKRFKYGFQGILYNKAHPHFTHLLEKSHVIRNQWGDYGRTSPGHGQVIHIEPARDKAEEYLIQLLMSKINNV